MKKNIRKILKRALLSLTISSLLVSPSASVCANVCDTEDTSIKKTIEATGSYSNWDGVTNVSQFKDKNDEFCFAYNTKKYVVVVKTKDGHPTGKTLKLKKKTSIFGAVTCDKDGYYYVVTGKNNDTNDTKQNTIFISKYDEKGKLVKSVGDNGRSSLASYYDDSFATCHPFDGGNCDVAVNGEYLAVNYAREMYSGHQSNSLFLINKKTMTKVQVDSYYNSHSFSQRVVPYQNDFILASEGDCYDRAFTVSTVNTANGKADSQNTFDFWVPKGTLDEYNMYVLNDNFAHLGGIAAGTSGYAALVGTSAKSLNKNAKKENEQLFIQIFNPTKNLRQASGYMTEGSRSGYAGPNGDQKVTNYGVKWLTNYSKSYEIDNPQIISTPEGNYVVLFERYKNYKYQGVYYMVLNSSGKVTSKTTKLSASACLNPGEMPVYTNGSVYWAGNRSNGSKNMYIYHFKVK